MSDTHDASAPETREAAPPWNDDLQDLRRRAEIFRRLAEKSPVPVVLTRFGTSEILFTNTEADRVFDTGVPGARTMALNLYADPADREIVLAKLRADGAMRNHAVRLRRRDGSIGDYLMSMIPTEVEGDRVLYTYVLDISARVAAEQALQARSEEMGLILDNVTQGLLIIAADGALLGEHSAVVDRWLGRISAGESVWAAIARGDAEGLLSSSWVAALSEVGAARRPEADAAGRRPRRGHGRLRRGAPHLECRHRSTSRADRALRGRRRHRARVAIRRGTQPAGGRAWRWA